MAYLYKSFNGIDLPKYNVETDIGPGDAQQAFIIMPNGEVFDYHGESNAPRDKREIIIKAILVGDSVLDLRRKWQIQETLFGQTGELTRSFLSMPLRTPTPQAQKNDDLSTRIYWDSVQGATGYRVQIEDVIGTLAPQAKKYDDSSTRIYWDSVQGTPTPQAKKYDDSSTRIYWDSVQGATGYRVQIEDNVDSSTAEEPISSIDQIIEARCVRVVGSGAVSQNQKMQEIEIGFILFGSLWKSTKLIVITHYLRMGVDQINIAKLDLMDLVFSLENIGNSDIHDAVIGIYSGERGLSNIQIKILSLSRRGQAKCGFTISKIEPNKTLWVDCGRFSVLNGDAEKMLGPNGVDVYERFTQDEPHLYESWFPFAPGENTVSVLTGNYSKDAAITIRYRHTWR